MLVDEKDDAAVEWLRAEPFGNEDHWYPSGEPRRRVASAGRPLASWRTEVLRGEDVAAFNPREAFSQGQEFRYFAPLSGVAEIGKIKPPTPGVLKSGKLRFE